MEMFFFQQEVIVFTSGSFIFLSLVYVSIFLSHRDASKRKIKQKLMKYKNIHKSSHGIKG